MIEEIANSLIEKGIEIAENGLTVAETFVFNKIWDKYKSKANENTSKLDAIVRDKLKNVTKEELTEANSHLAISLLYLNSYTDDDQLRELFGNLLFASMKRETKEKAHVSFVRILEQLSPAEAYLIKSTSILREYNPIARISYQQKKYTEMELLDKNYTGQKFKDNDLFYDPNTTKRLYHHVALFDVGLACEEVSFLIENLARLNLIEIDYKGFLDEESYKNFKRVKEMEEIMQSLIREGEANEEYHLVYNAGAISPTEYGKKFYEICVK